VQILEKESQEKKLGNLCIKQKKGGMIIYVDLALLLLY